MKKKTPKLPKPIIGWVACEQRFYFDALPISDAEAVKHWREGTAKFLPNAEKRAHRLATHSDNENMIGVPPRELPHATLPCGYRLKEHSFGHRLAHYRTCQHPYCNWRAQAAKEISKAVGRSVVP